LLSHRKRAAIRCWILPRAQATLVEECRQSKKVETGGILLGKWLSDQAVVVACATGPGPRAKKTTISLELDLDYCQKELDKVFQMTGGRVSFLGDWHSHLSADIWPSAEDSNSLRLIACTPAFQCSSPLLVICSQRMGQIRVHAYWWSSEEQTPLLIRRVTLRSRPKGRNKAWRK
jgi:integrative and conjugative element protein (TIGR02256 family)